MSAILIMEAVVIYVLIPMEATIVLVCITSNLILFVFLRGGR